MKKNKIFNKSAIFLILIILAVVGFVIFCIFTFKSNMITEKINEKKSFSLLTTVSDNNKLIFANIFFYNPGTNKGCFLDVPVNLGGLITSHKKILRFDDFYLYGDTSKYINELNNILDTQIDFNIDMKLSNFCDIIDVLGGIDIFIPDPKNISINGKINIIPSGNYCIDGFKSYINLQDTESPDVLMDRLKFTNQFYHTLGKQNKTFLKTKNLNVINKRIKTNLDRSSLRSLIVELDNLRDDSLDFKQIYGKEKDVGSGVNVLFPNMNGAIIKNLVKSIYSAITNSDNSVSNLMDINIEILNGTDVNLLGKKTADLFKSYGYNVVNIRNADTTNILKTEIIDRIGNSSVLLNISNVIKCKNLKVEKGDLENQNEAFFPHYTVILGKDFNGKYCK